MSVFSKKKQEDATYFVEGIKPKLVGVPIADVQLGARGAVIDRVVVVKEAACGFLHVWHVAGVTTLLMGTSHSARSLYLTFVG